MNPKNSQQQLWFFYRVPGLHKQNIRQFPTRFYILNKGGCFSLNLLKPRQMFLNLPAESAAGKMSVFEQFWDRFREVARKILLIWLKIEVISLDYSIKLKGVR